MLKLSWLFNLLINKNELYMKSNELLKGFEAFFCYNVFSIAKLKNLIFKYVVLHSDEI